MIFEVIKIILKNAGLNEDEIEITAKNILDGFRKFPKSEKVTVLNLINKLKVMTDYEE